MERADNSWGSAGWKKENRLRMRKTRADQAAEKLRKTGWGPGKRTWIRRMARKKQHSITAGDYARQKRLVLKAWIHDEHVKARKRGMQARVVPCPMGLRPHVEYIC